MISVMPISSIYNLYISNDKEYVRVLTNILGFVPKNLSLYKLAFRHKSAGNQVKKGFKDSNERLEFLGDAILGAVVAELLFKRSEEHTSELQSLMRTSYAVFCLKKNKKNNESI